ncbi:L,D-transpeptidase family protein [Billgrantia pellis]|uniref:L,D-transpeptidase family protein n=1 Tax=Billgrantia pellis TaxID=2606936 RepID=A0A7V7KHD8_9GAMM|nr:L,D-transpeptidase family protein [Halomonas pellis]KAA0011134.1 L,D-transpeptidase family protein [Halomonas pellis]
MTHYGVAGQCHRPLRRLAWLPLLLGMLSTVLLSPSVAWSEENTEPQEAEWPKGHYPLPEQGDVVGERYTVEAREEQTLLDIAREHNVGYEEIRRANPEVSVWMPGEGTEVVIPGRFILPPVERKGIVINVAELRLYYYPEVGEGETPRVETYPIGIGREGFDTPLGRTQTTMRLKNPAWYPPSSVRREAAERGEEAPAVVPPGPDNPLGSHAIMLDIPGYLIHGTNKPDGIGMRASRGCIRMFPEDIESIFERVPVGMQVNIVHQPIKAGWDGDTPYVQVYEALKEQEAGMAALMETLALLERSDDEPSVPLNYERLRELLESPNGLVVALDATAMPEPEPQKEEGSRLWDELAV